MREEPKTMKMLVVDSKYLLLVTFILGVFISFSILLFMIPIADPTPWMGNILMFCAGFFMSTVLLNYGIVIVNKEDEQDES